MFTSLRYCVKCYGIDTAFVNIVRSGFIWFSHHFHLCHALGVAENLQCVAQGRYLSLTACCVSAVGLMRKRRKRLLAIHMEWELQAACWSCSLQLVKLLHEQLKKVEWLNLRFLWILTYWFNWDFSFCFCTFSFPVNDDTQQTNTCFDKVFFCTACYSVS